MIIGVVTTTRSEYGLLKNIIKKINDDSDCELSLIVSGTHLIDEFGYTEKFIEDDGFLVAHSVYVPICTNSPYDISLTMAHYMEAFAKLFAENNFDFLVVLGDRYELIPICSCAFNARIPIAHISGGEITEGAIDDAIRHCITKLSYLHFPATERYRKRVIQLGEEPSRVINVGDPGVENVYKMVFPTQADLEKKLSIPHFDKYFLVVFHPITLDSFSPSEQIRILLEAISKFDQINFIFLKSNADMGGEKINEIIDEYINCHSNCLLFSSVPIEDFLALQRYSLGLIGNSSSGIVETPCFSIPTINIGDRQKGRLFAESIISVNLNSESIAQAIAKALSSEFREKIVNVKNPYGFDDTARQIVKIIKETYKQGINLKKHFYDLE